MLELKAGRASSSECDAGSSRARPALGQGQRPGPLPRLVLQGHLHKEGGGWVLVSVLGQEVDVAVSWQVRGWGGAHKESSSHSGRMLRGTATPAQEMPGTAFPPTPRNLALPSPRQTLTLLEAVQGDGALADEVVLGGGVVVLDHEAHEGQLRHRHVKLKLRVPPRVETWGHGRRVSGWDTSGRRQARPRLGTHRYW